MGKPPPVSLHVNRHILQVRASRFSWPPTTATTTSNDEEDAQLHRHYELKHRPPMSKSFLPCPPWCNRCQRAAHHQEPSCLMSVLVLHTSMYRSSAGCELQLTHRKMSIFGLAQPKEQAFSLHPAKVSRYHFPLAGGVKPRYLLPRA